MTPKPQHYARTLYELTKDAKVADADRAVERLVRALHAKNRGGMLERILSEYRKLLLKRNASLEMEVRSAVPLPDELQRTIRQKVGAPKEAVLKETVDPSLIGGVKVKYNDTLFDTSLRHRLKSLEQSLLR